MSRRVLHLTNDFSGSKVYRNLCRELDRLGFIQTVYTPVRNESLINKNENKF